MLRFLPLITQLEYFKDILGEWGRAAASLCDEIHVILLAHTKNLVDQHFDGQEVLQHQIQFVFRTIISSVLG